MWLFGYGSLMWDGWEERHGCARRLPADLPGHGRIFNKTSIERWGTRDRPGLTLNLKTSGACRGVAFEFDDTAARGIVDYLTERETCRASELPIRLQDHREVSALVYVYEGPRLIDEGLPLADRAAMILAAEGIAGTCFDYIKGVRAHLAELGVADPAVDELWEAVRALKESSD